MLPVGYDLRVDGDEVHHVVEKLVTRQRSPGLVVQHWYHFLSSRLPVRAGASTSPESHQPALRIPATHATSHAPYRFTGVGRLRAIQLLVIVIVGRGTTAPRG